MMAEFMPDGLRSGRFLRPLLKLASFAVSAEAISAKRVFPADGPGRMRQPSLAVAKFADQMCPGWFLSDFARNGCAISCYEILEVSACDASMPRLPPAVRLSRAGCDKPLLDISFAA